MAHHKRDMPIIRPISDLRNKSAEIEEICRDTGGPVFITKNGEGDLVVMSLAAYERDQARLIWKRYVATSRGLGPMPPAGSSRVCSMPGLPRPSWSTAI
jgi:prevent-host-death family protein